MFARTTRDADIVLPAPSSTTQLPSGVLLVPDHELRILSGGRVLVGGRPTRLVSLGPKAAQWVGAWLEGHPVSDDHSDRRLARRLVLSGLFHPRPPTYSTEALATVVIPVRNRPKELANLLASLDDEPCIVVDDCSIQSAAIEKIATRAGAQYIRLHIHSGAAAARNAGFERVSTPLVAFIDSDCTVPRGWIDELVGHFADPRVALVAPRIVSVANQRHLSRFERARSPLDLGPFACLVGPGTRVPYIPSAAIVVRRSVTTGRCFDERLAAGEDVDFVWRLVESGWEARYAPYIQVRHQGDDRFIPWLSRRVLYGSTAGPLGIRHPEAIVPARMSPNFAAFWILIVSRHPGMALGVLTASVISIAAKISRVVEHPVKEATYLSTFGVARVTISTVNGITRTWNPALILIMILRPFRSFRPLIAALLTVSAMRGWKRQDGLDPIHHLVVGLADDIAYGIGVWWGCLKVGTLRPLLPAVRRLRPSVATTSTQRGLGATR